MSMPRLTLRQFWVYGGLVFLSLLLALDGQPIPPIFFHRSPSICFIFALFHAGQPVCVLCG